MISLSMTLLSREKYISLSTERFFLSKSFDGIYHGVYIDHKRSFDYMVKQSRDNEKKKNSGENKENSCHNFPLCHYFWNLNSGKVQNSIKASLLKAHSPQNTYGVMYISATYIDNSALNCDHNLVIQSCSLIGTDHPFNTKRGRVR